jgi:hypothetical protein
MKRNHSGSIRRFLKSYTSRKSGRLRRSPKNLAAIILPSQVGYEDIISKFEDKAVGLGRMNHVYVGCIKLKK